MVQRRTCLRFVVYGPRGIGEMTDHLLAAYRVDIDNRMRERGETTRLVNAHDVSAGLVYEDQRVKVTAFDVMHGDLQAYGYRFRDTRQDDRHLWGHQPDGEHRIQLRRL